MSNQEQQDLGPTMSDQDQRDIVNVVSNLMSTLSKQQQQEVISAISGQQQEAPATSSMDSSANEINKGWVALQKQAIVQQDVDSEAVLVCLAAENGRLKKEVEELQEKLQKTQKEVDDMTDRYNAKSDTVVRLRQDLDRLYALQGTLLNPQGRTRPDPLGWAWAGCNGTGF